MKLTVPAHFEGGVWFPETVTSDKRADVVWSEAARNNAIDAAAATTDSSPFAKFPDWVAACFAGWEGTFLDAGCGYGRVSIPLLKANPGLRCVKRLFNSFTRVAVEVHQMIVLPRSIGFFALPFAPFSRRVNRYCSGRFMGAFKHSSWFVNHHDVVATK